MDPGHGTSAAAGVRDLVEGDLATTAALHERSLPDGFFARLGQRFLRCYHRSFVDSPHAVALGAPADGELHGFLLAVLAPGPHGRYVVRRWGSALALRGALALVVRPEVLVLFLRTRAVRYARALWRRRRTQAAPGGSAPAAASAVLSHVAVRDEARRGGRGAVLVEALHVRAAAAGADAVVLVTDPHGPGPGFYRRLGYDELGTGVGSDGQQWTRFRFRLR